MIHVRVGEKCYTFHQIIFLTSEHEKKKAHEPLRLLDSPPIFFVHQMLHWCNIFKRLTAPWEENITHFVIHISTYR